MAPLEDGDQVKKNIEEHLNQLNQASDLKSFGEKLRDMSEVMNSVSKSFQKLLFFISQQPIPAHLTCLTTNDDR